MNVSFKFEDEQIKKEEALKRGKDPAELGLIPETCYLLTISGEGKSKKVETLKYYDDGILWFEQWGLESWRQEQYSDAQGWPDLLAGPVIIDSDGSMVSVASPTWEYSTGGAWALNPEEFEAEIEKLQPLPEKCKLLMEQKAIPADIMFSAIEEISKLYESLFGRPAKSGDFRPIFDYCLEKWKWRHQERDETEHKVQKKTEEEREQEKREYAQWLEKPLSIDELLEQFSY